MTNDEWRFDENPQEHETYDPGGVGRWGNSRTMPHQNTEKTQMTTETKKPLGATDVLTPTFRASYLNVLQARASDPTKPEKKEYGVEMWFRVAHTPESKAAGEETVSVSDLVKAAEAAAAARWGNDRTKWPKFKYPLFKKGEENTGKQGPIPGVIIVRCKRPESFGLPVVVDQDRRPINDKSRVYSGCYMRAKLHAHAWPQPGKPATYGNGVSFTLDMVQLVRDGEPLGSHMSAEDAFDAIPVPGGVAMPSATGGATPAAPAGDMFGGMS